jgi:hypothetical protein
MDRFSNTANFKPLGIVVILIGAWFGIYFAWSRIESVDFTRYYSVRFKAVRQAIAQLPLEKPAVLFFGRSEVALNVSPLQIESQIPGVDVYNFGVLMVGPDEVRLLVEEMKQSLKHQGKKLKLVALSFSPMFFTQRYRTTIRTSRFPQFVSHFPFGWFIKNSNWEDPNELAQVLFVKLVNGGVAQGDGQTLIRYFVGDHKHGGKNSSKAIAGKIWERESLAPDGVFWNPAKKGEIDFYSGDSHDLRKYISEHASDIYEWDYLSHCFLFDPIHYNFDEEFFRSFDRTIEALKEVSEHVAVYYVPDFFAPQSPATTYFGQLRLRAKIEQFKNDPRVVFWDYSDFPMSSDNFIDISHMTIQGKELLNRRLAKSLLESVQ